MRAVQVKARGRVEFVDAPKPELQPGHVLVKCQTLSLCGSDMYMIHHMPESMYPLPPGTSGHEMVGVVEAIDEPGSHSQVGDEVLALVHGQTAMAEYYLAPADFVFKLPAGKPKQHLLQAQQFGTVIYGCKVLPNIIGKNVVIIGQGSVGLWFATMVKRLGAYRIITVDIQEHRLAASKLYGATHTIHNRDMEEADVVTALENILDGELADVVIDAAGEPPTIRLAYELIRQNGFVLYFGLPHMDELVLHPMNFFRKTATTRTIVGANDDPNLVSTRMALDLIASGAVDVGPMMTHTFPFDQVMDAYELHSTRDEGAIKIAVDLF